MSDSFDLQRFVDAQASIYRQVVEELSRDENRHTGCGSSFGRSPVSASARWLNASRSAHTLRPSLTWSIPCSGLAWSNARASSWEEW